MKKKVITTLALVFCAVALVIGSVAGTLAYLRVSASVTNIFTYGKVAITLDESAVDESGVVQGTARVTGNRYKLMPGTTYTKDPIIHVDTASEDMFLFLKVDNGIAGLALTPEEAGQLGKKTIHDQLLANGWKVYVNEAGDSFRKSTTTNVNGFDLLSTSTVYYYSVGAGESETAAEIVDGAAGDIPTFATFTTSPSASTEDTMTAYVLNNAQVMVTAYAIQSTGEGISGNVHYAALKFAAEFESARVPNN